MKQKLILVIDDDNDVRYAIVGVLKRLGYSNILEASDGQKGLEIVARSEKPDLVITDLSLPGMRGEEVIRRITRDYLAIKTIAISGDMRETVEPVVKAAGCKVFLSKPLKARELRQAMEELLA